MLAGVVWTSEQTSPRIVELIHECIGYDTSARIALRSSHAIVRQDRSKGNRSQHSNELCGWHRHQTEQLTPIQIYIKSSSMYRMRSKTCRISEFRTSQCVSQLAAFFLDPRTKAFTVANIKNGRHSKIANSSLVENRQNCLIKGT